MLLRICLILAILAGLGVIGISQFKLREQITEIIEKRDYNKTQWDKTAGELKNTKKTLTETKDKLTKTESTLEETKAQLTATTAKFETEQKRANGLQQTLNTKLAELKAATDELAAWTNTGLRVEQVREVVKSEKDLRLANDALRDESRLFKEKADKLQKQLEYVLGRDQDPPVPRDVRGKVLVVDPKWDFLLLDVGARQNVPPRGVLLVSRNGELVAKVRVMTVQDQRSIANIMPGWKLKDVMEGDAVLPY